MALGNYDWTAIRGNRSRITPYPLYEPSTGTMLWLNDLESAEIVADEATGSFYCNAEASVWVQPNVDDFTGMHSGRFFFLFGPDNPFPSAAITGVPEDQPSVFRFYKQRAGTGYTDQRNFLEFIIKRNQVPNGRSWVRFYLNSVTTNDGRTTRNTIMTCNTRVEPNSPWCAGIEWITNGASQAELSSDLSSPSLPDLQFIFRFGPESHDPEEARPIASIFIELPFLSTRDPELAYDLVTALGTYGGGFYDWLTSFDDEFSGSFFTVGDTFTYNSTNHVITLSDGTIVPLGATFFAKFFQEMFALNAERENEGFVPGADGLSGLIQPVEREDWTINTGCIGWQWDLLGFAELLIAIQLETWEPPLFPVDVIEIIEEEWES